MEKREIKFHHLILENKKKLLQMSYFKALNDSKLEIMKNIINNFNDIKLGKFKMKASSSIRLLDKSIK